MWREEGRMLRQVPSLCSYGLDLSRTRRSVGIS